MAHPQKSTFLRSTRRILSAPPYRIRPHQHRSLHNTPCRPNQPLSANTATTATNSNRDPPAATSTSAAQPFSTPLYPSPETTGVSSKSASPQSTKNKPKIVSSVPAGTPLKGLNYFKNKTDPVAMVDEEYPDWLWTVLDEPSREGHSAADETGSKDPRLFSKSANARRMANKRARKYAMESPEEAEQRVPIYEQSVDLPNRDPLEAREAREELTSAMREKRRKDIKEGNFLRGMR